MFNKKNKINYDPNLSLAPSIISGTSEKYSPSVSDIQSFFLNDMNKIRVTDLYASREDGRDIGINYKYNSYGYRGPEPKNNNDILILGCSQTFGIGIRDVINTWPAILSNSLNLNYFNLAKSGSSVNSQIRRAFAYFKKFGHPKYIFAIFPDFQRMEFPINYRTLVANKDEVNGPKSGLSVKHLKHPTEIPKVSSMPHDARDIFTEELSYFISMQYILMLEQYCDTAGIKLVWSTWSDEDEALILKLKEMSEQSYKNFTSLHNYKWLRNYESQQEEFYDKNYNNLYPHRTHCHEKYSNLEDFNIAIDVIYNFHTAHSGVHRHIHWAETLADYAIKNKWVNK
jgi:hypothetical protein